MKRFLTLLIIAGSFALRAQTATNFNANDCNGVNHDLFTELNSGKVVVICWVMPCGSCIAPAQGAHNIVQSYSVSNPGQVLFYLVDDYGNSSCTTINNWAATNSLTNFTSFSNSSISMSNYGSDGMPKIVVVGGTAHNVYYNQNGALNSSSLTAAINAALAGSPTNIGEILNTNFSTKLSPVPAREEITFNYVSDKASEFSIMIYNIAGQEVRKIRVSAQKGRNESTINVEDLAEGTYYAKISDAGKSDVVKLVVGN